MKSPGLVVLLAACSFRASPAETTPADASDAAGGGGGGGGGSDIDAALPLQIDAMLPPPIDANTCFGQGVVHVCLDSAPTQAVTLPGVMTLLDTSVDTNCTKIATQSSGPDLCVIAGKTVTVSAAFTAIGARPLVLIASDALTVSGTLDVSSTRNGPRKGAGANDLGCSVAGNGKNDSGGGGGGAGGSFGTLGGTGGTGDLDNSNPPAGTAPGGAPGAAQAMPTVLRGGCKGGSGGDGANTDVTHTGGAGGDGGGAVVLIAGNRIMISGDVFASGAGGSVSPGASGSQQGAGGGGSGGMIGLDAPTIQVQGHIAANGGAGGGGGANSGGTSGDDGTTTMWNKRALGGIGDKTMGRGNDAGDGSPGSAVIPTALLDGGAGDAAGGGAGGGLGLVMTWGPDVTGTMISPAPIKH